MSIVLASRENTLGVGYVRLSLECRKTDSAVDTHNHWYGPSSSIHRNTKHSSATPPTSQDLTDSNGSHRFQLLLSETREERAMVLKLN